MKQQWNGGAAGTRMSRYPEIDQLAKAGTTFYYSWWDFFPAALSFGGSDSYNHWQIASDNGAGVQAPIWVLGLSGSGMRLTLIWSPNDLAPVDGPHSNETGKRTYTGVVVPVGQWVFFEVVVTPRGDFTGAIRVWPMARWFSIYPRSRRNSRSRRRRRGS